MQANLFRSERLALTAVFVTGMAGDIITTVKPILVTAFVRSLHFGEAQAGLLVGLDMATFSIGTLLVSWRLYRWPRTALAAGALLLVAAGNAASMAFATFAPMVIARLLAGLGSGLAAGIAAATLSNMPRSESRFGLYMIVMACGAALISGLIGEVLQRHGSDAMFATLALLVLPALALSRVLPPLRTIERPLEESGSGKRLALGPVAILVGSGIYFLAAGGVWAFVGQIGLNRGLSSGTVGTILGGSLLAGAVGALVPFVLRDRLGFAVPIALSVTLTAACLATMGLTNGLPGYVVGVCGFMLAWFVFFPFVMGLCTRFDPLGRLGTLCYGVSGAAQAVGPTLAGITIERLGMSYLLVAAMVGIPLGAGLLLLATRGGSDLRSLQGSDRATSSPA